MSSLVTGRRLGIVAVALVVIIGVLTMHGLLSTAGTEHGAFDAPAFIGHHGHADGASDYSDTMLHLGAVCVWILAGAAALLLRPALNRTTHRLRRPVRRELLASSEPTGRSPDRALGAGLLRC
jgi:hypothetical protein